MTAMDPILLEGSTDRSNLTAAQWERVRSPIVEVAVGKARTAAAAAGLPQRPLCSTK